MKAKSMNKKIGIWVIVWLVTLSAVVLGWPRPAGVPRDGQWTLNIRYEHPVQISVKMPGWDQPRRFWYMIISLTNETSEEDVPFYPKFELVTDTFQVLPAGLGEHRGLFELVKARYQGSYPFLESLDFTDHLIRHGEDNTRDFVIFWPDFDPNVKQIQFYLAGLSNETAAIPHPIEVDAQGNPILVYLKKTLQLNYSIGADPRLRGEANLRFEGQDWVLR